MIPDAPSAEAPLLHPQCPFTRAEWRAMIAEIRGDVHDLGSALGRQMELMDGRLRTVEQSWALVSREGAHIEGIETRLREIERALAVTQTHVTIYVSLLSAGISLGMGWMLR